MAAVVRCCNCIVSRYVYLFSNCSFDSLSSEASVMLLVSQCFWLWLFILKKYLLILLLWCVCVCMCWCWCYTFTACQCAKRSIFYGIAVCRGLCLNTLHVIRLFSPPSHPVILVSDTTYCADILTGWSSWSMKNLQFSVFNQYMFVVISESQYRQRHTSVLWMSNIYLLLKIVNKYYFMNISIGSRLSMMQTWVIVSTVWISVLCFDTVLSLFRNYYWYLINSGTNRGWGICLLLCHQPSTTTVDSDSNWPCKAIATAAQLSGIIFGKLLQSIIMNLTIFT